MRLKRGVGEASSGHLKYNVLKHNSDRPFEVNVQVWDAGVGMCDDERMA